MGGPEGIKLGLGVVPLLIREEGRRPVGRGPGGHGSLGYAAQRFNACFLIKIALPATQSLRPVM